jgi:hypothetical protein
MGTDRGADREVKVAANPPSNEIRFVCGEETRNDHSDECESETAAKSEAKRSGGRGTID